MPSNLLWMKEIDLENFRSSTVIKQTKRCTRNAILIKMDVTFLCSSDHWESLLHSTLQINGTLIQPFCLVQPRLWEFLKDRHFIVASAFAPRLMVKIRVIFHTKMCLLCPIFANWDNVAGKGKSLILNVSCVELFCLKKLQFCFSKVETF